MSRALDHLAGPEHVGIFVLLAPLLVRGLVGEVLSVRDDGPNLAFRGSFDGFSAVIRRVALDPSGLCGPEQAGTGLKHLYTTGYVVRVLDSSAPYTIRSQPTALADGCQDRRTMMRLLTLREVTGMTALSRSAVYALMAASRFPKPIRIGERAVRWVEKEVLDFIASRPRGGSERPAA